MMNIKRLFLIALGLLVLNSGYLYSFESPTLFYVSNVFVHLGLGLALIILLVLFWRRYGSSLTWDGQLACVVLAVASASGIYLFFTGATRPYYGIVVAHIAVSMAGILLMVVHLIVRRQGWLPLGAFTALAVAIPVVVQLGGLNRFPEIVNPIVVPTTMEQEGAGPDSEFFPSSANTNVNHTIPSTFFMKPDSCGRSGCHPDIYKQWQTSAHHFGSFNNQWYRKAILYMQDTIGTKPSKWCGGCHDHAVFFNGMMDKPIKDQLDRPEATVGLTCTSCHSIVSVHSTMGNGSFVIEYPPLHDLATSDNPLLRYLHDFVVKLDPGPHRETFMKPFMREQPGEFCSACHKVHLDLPVNNYRWIRGFNEYDGWQTSGVSGEGARSFYYPDHPKACPDCHMPLIQSHDAGNVDGVVHDHRFPGANTALPTANGFKDQLKLVEDFLTNDQVGVDIFALSEPSEEAGPAAAPAAQETLQTSSTFAEGDELGFAVGGRGAGYTAVQKIVAPIDKVQPVVRRGDSVRVNVVVRTKGVGHFFPGGTVDAFEVWVELKAVDDKGKVIFWSGYVPEYADGRKGPVDPSAHFYRSLMLDEQGNPINKRNAWATRTVAYVRLIPPGAADTVHFKLDIPKDVGEKIYLTAKVNYRKFAWWNTQWAYAGERDPNDPNPDVGPGHDNGKWVFTANTSDVAGKLKEIPEVPIVKMAQSEAQLRVLGDGEKEPEQDSILDHSDLIRWNDFGIGLLLQGDLKAAEDVFTRVTEIDPNFADGWVNIGRALELEGRPEEAKTVLLKALAVDPELAKTHFFLGMSYKSTGDYDSALAEFRKAHEKYPRDRVVLNQIGRLLFLKREFEDAVSVLNQVLLVDPEDLQAHYNLMLCYRALRDQDRAQHEQTLYLRFKADESAQAITGPYLREHPHDNNERQAIHEHESYPLDQIPADRRMVSNPAGHPAEKYTGGR
ncbi:MAG: tetratricopeptide repeat protein [Acidobacteriota bacterium]